MMLLLAQGNDVVPILGTRRIRHLEENLAAAEVLLSDAEREDAARVYEILAKLGGRELVGDSPRLAPGTFWTGFDF